MLERIDPKAPARLPLLFAVDWRLDIGDGFRYALDRKPGTGTCCASHIGCGSGGGSGGGGSGDGGSGDGGSDEGPLHRPDIRLHYAEFDQTRGDHRMDAIDQAQDEIEAAILESLSKRRAAPDATATGRCLNCDAPVGRDQRWCDAECRDEWLEANAGG
ncbi:MAG: hypothetical protein ACOZDY_15575 [Pseudomonadota bacterium]